METIKPIAPLRRAEPRQLETADASEPDVVAARPAPAVDERFRFGRRRRAMRHWPWCRLIFCTALIVVVIGASLQGDGEKVVKSLVLWAVLLLAIVIAEMG